jgi:hypothetical protein
MKAAVLMSVYHRERPERFARAVDSILRQDLPEGVTARIYLGVDGPLPPELASMVDSYKDRVHRIEYFSQNRGLSHVLNDLIGTLEDEAFVFRMDTDDVSHPQRFRKQLAFMLENQDVDVLGTAMYEVDEASSQRRIVYFETDRKVATRNIARGVPVAHPTVCIRRSVFSKVRGYPCTGTNEDIALWFECVRQGLVFCNLREPLFDFTIDANFLSRRRLDKAWSEFAVYVRGVWRTNPWSMDYVYPVARLALRVSPRPIQSFAYKNRFGMREVVQA